MKFELGDVVKDIITGLEGVVMVRAEYLTNCTHIGIQPFSLKDGIPQDWIWIDERRCKKTSKKRIVLKEEARISVEVPKRTGGPQPNPPQL